MNNDFPAWLNQFSGLGYDLHQKHLNPVFVKMLRAIGFDKTYVRGEGAIFGTAKGKVSRPADRLGCFCPGTEPSENQIGFEAIAGHGPANLVRMECSLLSGLAARRS